MFVFLFGVIPYNSSADWIKDENEIKINLLTPFPDIQNHSNVGYRYFFEVNVTTNTTGNTLFISSLTLLRPNNTGDQALICFQFCGYELVASTNLYYHYNLTFILWLWNSLIFPTGEYQINFTSSIQYLDTGEKYYDSFTKNFTLINSNVPQLTVTDTTTNDVRITVNNNITIDITKFDTVTSNFSLISLFIALTFVLIIMRKRVRN